MAKEEQMVELEAPTVEEAVLAGLARLNVPKEMVDVEVVDEGRRGLLGIGGRNAIVRLRVRKEPKAKKAAAPKTPVVEKVAEPAVAETPAKLTEIG